MRYAVGHGPQMDRRFRLCEESASDDRAKHVYTWSGVTCLVIFTNAAKDNKPHSAGDLRRYDRFLEMRIHQPDFPGSVNLRAICQEDPLMVEEPYHVCHHE